MRHSYDRPRPPVKARATAPSRPNRRLSRRTSARVSPLARAREKAGVSGSAKCANVHAHQMSEAVAASERQLQGIPWLAVFLGSFRSGLRLDSASPTVWINPDNSKSFRYERGMIPRDRFIDKPLAGGRAAFCKTEAMAALQLTARRMAAMVFQVIAPSKFPTS